MLHATIKQPPPQPHGTGLGHQFVAAKTVAVLQPRFRSPDAIVVDPAAAEEIIDKRPGGSDRAGGVYRTCIWRCRSSENSPGL